jgi:hypothetical protein
MPSDIISAIQKMKITKLFFKKTTEQIDSANYGHIDLSDSQNLEKITKYILPIITQNEGWDTTDITPKRFKENPFHYQEAIDASLFANVHVALSDSGEPLGLIEYLEETIEDPLSIERMNNLKKLLTSRDEWRFIIDSHVISEKFLDKHFRNLTDFFREKYIYSEIGLTVKPSLQGKRSGVSEELYKTLKKGILFGWTNNPILLSQWKKTFENVIFFPMFGEEYTSLEYLACLALLYADLLTYDKDRWQKYEFGALSSTYFVTKRSKEYLEITQNLITKNKISEKDGERIRYCIDRESVQGAVFAFN